VIPVAGATDVAFGGVAGTTLFVSTLTSLYRVELTIPGVP
jgi:hypothetical protein